MRAWRRTCTSRSARQVARRPAIDPKPILDGWKLLEATAIYRAAGKNPFFGPDARNPTIGQIMLMSKDQLEHQVLNDPRIEVYDCGRRDVLSGQVDRRVLATLKFLTSSGLKPTVSSLKCGHSYLSKAGTVSEHSSGNAVDIAAVNGIPIIGHQGTGSITDITIRRLLTLQGSMKPHQIISLMTFKGADNTLVADRPRRPHPRRLLPAVLGQARQPVQRRPEARPVDQADRPPQRDRQPRRPRQAVEGRHPDGADQPRPRRRVTPWPTPASASASLSSSSPGRWGPTTAAT